MLNRRLWYIILALVLVLSVVTPVAAAAPGNEAPLLAQNAEGAIPGSYIVVFKDGVGPAAAEHMMRGVQGQGGEVTYRYDAALNGFAVKLPEQALNGILHNPLVAYVEADQVMTADTTQSGATWGLDRIDQRSCRLTAITTTPDRRRRHRLHHRHGHQLRA